MMEASIKRDGNHVALSVTIDIPFYNATYFTFIWNCESGVYAGLLADAMQRQTKETLKTIRREAYGQGWRDAKAKRKKATFFGGCWS